jgi:hypothetical protein
MWYTLGDYTLDTQRYELCRAGLPLPLQPKSSSCSFISSSTVTEW